MHFPLEKYFSQIGLDGEMLRAQAWLRLKKSRLVPPKVVTVATRSETDLQDDALGDPQRLEVGGPLPKEAKRRIGDAAGGLELCQLSVALKQVENSSKRHLKSFLGGHDLGWWLLVLHILQDWGNRKRINKSYCC